MLDDGRCVRCKEILDLFVIDGHEFGRALVAWNERNLTVIFWTMIYYGCFVCVFFYQLQRKNKSNMELVQYFTSQYCESTPKP